MNFVTLSDAPSATAPLALYVHWPFCVANAHIATSTPTFAHRLTKSVARRALAEIAHEAQLRRGVERLDLLRRRHALADAADDGAALIEAVGKHGRSTTRDHARSQPNKVEAAVSRISRGRGQPALVGVQAFND